MTTPHQNKPVPAWRQFWSRFAEIAEGIDISPLERLEMRLARIEERLEALDSEGGAA